MFSGPGATFPLSLFVVLARKPDVLHTFWTVRDFCVGPPPFQAWKYVFGRGRCPYLRRGGDIGPPRARIPPPTSYFFQSYPGRGDPQPFLPVCEGHKIWFLQWVRGSSYDYYREWWAHHIIITDEDCQQLTIKQIIIKKNRELEGFSIRLSKHFITRRISSKYRTKYNFYYWG